VICVLLVAAIALAIIVHFEHVPGMAAETEVSKAHANDPGKARDLSGEADNDIAIAVGFPNSSTELEVQRIQGAHFVIRSTQKVSTGGFYLLLKLTGLIGKTVRLDLRGAPFNQWGTAIPQYSYIETLDAYKDFESTTQPSTPYGDEENGPKPRMGDRAALPDTRGQQWHYFSVSTREEDGVSLEQKFDRDSAYVAYRVPFTPRYNESFISQLELNRNLDVVHVGKSKGGNDLDLIKIPAGPIENAASKPCVLIYAREHPDEQDCSWIAQGAVQFLASDDVAAKALCNRCTFLIIPLFDPDGAITATHQNIIASFDPDNESPESRAYASWFKSWIDSGNRLDVILDFHNPPPSAAFHVACPLMEVLDGRLQYCLKLHEQIRNDLMSAGYNVRNTPWTTGIMSTRLCGWLSESFGALIQPYEVNSLTPRRQLNLWELRQIGKIMATSTVSYLYADSGTKLRASIDGIRAKRLATMKELAGKALGSDPIRMEYSLSHNRSDPRIQAPQQIISAPQSVTQ
jgi:hypothetical protein